MADSRTDWQSMRWAHACDERGQAGVFHSKRWPPERALVAVCYPRWSEERRCPASWCWIGLRQPWIRVSHGFLMKNGLARHLNAAERTARREGSAGVGAA